MPFNAYASGPLLQYGFDPFKNQEDEFGRFSDNNLLRANSWGEYLKLVKDHVETGVQILKDDTGAMLGGAAILQKDTTKNTVHDYYENLLKPINDVTDGFLEKRFQENISKGLSKADAIASMAQYYHKAIPTKIDGMTQDIVLDVRQNADKALKGFFAGKEGISNRAATPEEFEKIVKMLYEQAHRSLDAKQNLEQALKDFTNDKATSLKEKNHANAIKTIFTMAYLYHQGDESWNNAEHIKEEIGDKAYDISQHFLTDVRVRDIFENYKQFHDRYCDDVKANEKFNENGSLKNPIIKWQEISDDEFKEEVWSILKLNRQNLRNNPLFNYEDYNYNNLYKMLANENFNKIEPIIKPLLSFLSQVYRGQTLHIRAISKILDTFPNNPEIITILPELFKAVSTSNLERFGFISQSITSKILKKYKDIIPELDAMKNPIEQYLINYLWALKRSIFLLNEFSGKKTKDDTVLFENNIVLLNHNNALKLLNKEYINKIFNAILYDLGDFFKKIDEIKYDTDYDKAYPSFVRQLLLKPIKFSEQEIKGKTIAELYLNKDQINQMFQKILQFEGNILSDFSEEALNISKELPEKLQPSSETINQLFDKIYSNEQLTNIFFANPFLTKGLGLEKTKKFVQTKDIKAWYKIFSNPDLKLYLDKDFLQEQIKKLPLEVGLLDFFFESQLATDIFDDAKWITDQFEFYFKNITEQNHNQNISLYSKLMISILSNPDWEKYLTVERLNQVVDQLWTVIRANNLSSHYFSVFFTELLETSAAGKIAENKLIEFYNNARTDIDSESRVAIAIQRYVAGPCLIQRGRLIVLPIREEFANARGNNAGIAMEIHSYIPPEALNLIAAKIKEHTKAYEKNNLNMAVVVDKLRKKIEAVFDNSNDKVYSNAAINALDKLVAAEYDSNFHEFLSNLIHWLDDDTFQWNDDFKDQNVRWKSYLINSFVESGTAYEGASPVSCVKGIKERAFIGIKGLENDTTQIISAFEQKKDLLDTKLLLWASSPNTLLPDLVHQLEKEYTTLTLTNQAVQKAQETWRKKAQEEFEKITTKIKFFLPRYQVPSSDISKIAQISQKVSQWVRTDWSVFTADSQKLIIKNLKSIITNTDDELIKTIEKNYRLTEEDKPDIIKEINKLRSSINKKNQPVKHDTKELEKSFETLKTNALSNNKIILDEAGLTTLIHYLYYVENKPIDDINYADIVDLLEKDDGIKNINSNYKNPTERQKSITNIKNKIRTEEQQP